MANHPIDPTKITVISLSGSTTHTVKMGKQKKQLYCDEFCPRFKEVAIWAIRLTLHTTRDVSQNLLRPTNYQ